MGIMLKQYLDRFAAMEKKANETLSAEPEALVGVNSLPGSEHDQKVPEEAKKPDKEVQQGQPAGATSAEGAVNGGDAKPLNEDKLEVDQPLDNPEQKPMITDDALTAKEASAHLASLVGDLLKDIETASAPAPAQKQASCGGEGATHASTASTASTASSAPKKDEKKDDGKGEEKKASKTTIKLDDETIQKIAAAQAAFMAGRDAAGKAIKKAAEKKASANDPAANARELIKAACVKAAQESGLSQADAEAAADNAMAAAGVAPAEVAAADAGAATADAGAAAADADAAAADAGSAEAGIPDDVTEEELANAIVDLVSSGELDPNTAKALVEEIAGDEGGAAPTEDQAAEIIAQGLESGEITPEQAQEIAAAVEAGGADDASAAADAGAAAAEAQGAADAESAAQDAADEAQGAADAEEAMKAAAAQVRSETLQKVANHIIAKRNEKQASAKPGARVIQKVASILNAKKEALDAQAKKEEQAKQASAEERYMAGFRKKAEEMGVDPAALSRYMLERRQAEKAKTQTK